MDDSDELNATADRRLFEAEEDARTAILASELGVGELSLAGDRVGRASLLERCSTASVATDGQRMLAGTRQGVLAGRALDRLGEEFDVAAVGVGSRLLAAGADGRVCTWDGETWERLGSVEAPARFDGSLLAAADGVYRVGSEPVAMGLTRVADVTRGEDSFAATADGLYRRVGDDWKLEHERPTAVVDAGDTGVYAVDDRGVLEREGERWARRKSPVRPVDIAVADAVYGITADGTVLVEADPDHASDGQAGWRTHAVGFHNAVELAVH